jgi:hypothetical protein
MQLERESSAERCRTTRCNASASLTSTPPLGCQSLCGFAVVCWFGAEAALRLFLGLSPSVVRIVSEARADCVSTASFPTGSQRVELTHQRLEWISAPRGEADVLDSIDILVFSEESHSSLEN